MNKTTKLLMVSISFLLAATLSACKNITVNNREIDNAAATIADFDLPGGYTPDFTASLMGYTMVSYTPGNDVSHLYLVQSENVMDGKELEQGLSKMVPDAYDSNSRMTVIEKPVVNVRGQEVTAVISDGVNSENETYRQIMVVFQGKGGPALLVYSVPVDNWDQETVTNLLSSIQ